MENETAADPALNQTIQLNVDWEALEGARKNAETAMEVRKALGLYTEEEVAAVLQLTSTGTLATWRSQKAGPRNVKLGKKVFYTLNQLGSWINEVAAVQHEAHLASLPQNQEKKAA